MAKEKSKTPAKLSLTERLNQIDFNNPMASNLQGSKSTSSDKKKKQAPTKIQGLKTLQNTLGRQNMRKKSDYRTNKI
jgi:hypothetical protein